MTAPQEERRSLNPREAPRGESGQGPSDSKSLAPESDSLNGSNVAPIDFVREIFGDHGIAPDRQLIVFGLTGADRSGRVIRWCPTLDVAKSAIDEVAAKGDVYFGCSLQDPAAALAEARRRSEAKSEKPPSLDQTRGFSSTARAIGGVWLDLDVAGVGHKKANLPPTVDAALDLVGAMPLTPTCALSSGGGLHVWWLLKEPWIFESEKERAQAARIVYGWQCVARDLCAKRGWELDSTHDLARVLRLPGTVNRKYDVAVEVLR